MNRILIAALLSLALTAPAFAQQQTSQAEQDAVDFLGALSTVCKMARPAIAGWASEVRQSEMTEKQKVIDLTKQVQDLKTACGDACKSVAEKKTDVPAQK